MGFPGAEVARVLGVTMSAVTRAANSENKWNKKIETKPKYRTWIRKNKIIGFWAITCVILAISMLGFINSLFFLIAILALPFAYIALVISLTAYQFSVIGGDYQNKIHQLIIDRSKVNGNVIDIGCGSGNLIIKLAKRYPESKFTGIDFWGNEWEYSKKQCENNAKIENVTNTNFIKASASRLPFDSENFDHAVSCLTFHEVKDVVDKTDSLIEALRILKPNASFVFFDLFHDTHFFKSAGGIEAVIKRVGGEIKNIESLSNIMKLKFPLNTGKVLKYAVIIEGNKSSKKERCKFL
jgi:ubiquinone/menaquinone biosynthesis C-methylase UbiE